MIKDFLFSIQYFTRIPIKATLDYSPKGFRRGTYYFSLTAMVVSLLAVGLGLAMDYFKAAPFLITMAMMICQILVTGGYHLDGLADSCDGLFSGRDKERILEIMEDPTMGSFGTIALFFQLATEAWLVYQLVLAHQMILFLLLPGVGKVALLMLASLGQGAKKFSSANALIDEATCLSVLVNGLIVLLFAFFLKKHWATLFSLVAVGLLVALFHRFCKKKIGGIVGDNLGFVAEVAQLVVGIFLLSL